MTILRDPLEGYPLGNDAQRIEAVISAMEQESASVVGKALLFAGRADGWATATVSRGQTIGDYAVVLETAMISSIGTALEFGVFGEFDQNDNDSPTIFPVSANWIYRFRHVKGVPVTVRLAG